MWVTTHTSSTELDAGAAQHILTVPLTGRDQLVNGAAEADERFVDGVDLLPGGMPADDHYW
ncbi:hypothetical protein [Leucobacter sp. NPDC077196]|uniref:hypothetical protein n=1 Tax=Leucobacter sp. NPDC077196 TaxID=3154959 RepID=UPI0034178739